VIIRAPFVKSSLTYWENKCYEEYLLSNFDHNFDNHQFIGWSEEMWSGNKLQFDRRVKASLNKPSFFNFFKATKGAWWMPWV
jgi:hypothetical protein